LKLPHPPLLPSPKKAVIPSTTRSLVIYPPPREEECDAARPSDITSFRTLVKKRHELMLRQCKKIIFSSSMKYQHLIVLPREDIVWCPVFKAASSSWLNNLLALSYLPREEQERTRERNPKAPLKLVKPISRPIPTASSYQEYLRSRRNKNTAPKSFLIVRHPFTRLVSAYRDKMEKVGINSVDLGYYYKRHGKAMVAKYRREARRRFGEDFFSADNNFGSPVKNSRGKRVEGLPVFWEFVQYVKRSPMADEHWAPVYSYCSPCTLKYETIVHFEHLHDCNESDFLAETIAPLNHTLPESEERRNVHQPEGMTEDELTALYFEQLDEQDVKDLYRVYEKDFLLFGYSFTFRGKMFPSDKLIDLVHLL